MTMSLQLQLVFITASVLTLVFILLKIRKHKLNIDDSIIWILWSIVLLIFSIFPKVVDKISNFLGFMSTSNFILCLFVFFLYIIVFSQNITISILKQKNKELVQKLSLKEYYQRKDQNEK